MPYPRLNLDYLRLDAELKKQFPMSPLAASATIRKTTPPSVKRPAIKPSASQESTIIKPVPDKPAKPKAKNVNFSPIDSPHKTHEDLGFTNPNQGFTNPYEGFVNPNQESTKKIKKPTIVKEKQSTLLNNYNDISKEIELNGVSDNVIRSLNSKIKRSGVLLSDEWRAAGFSNEHLIKLIKFGFTFGENEALPEVASYILRYGNSDEARSILNLNASNHIFDKEPNILLQCAIAKIIDSDEGYDGFLSGVIRAIPSLTKELKLNSMVTNYLVHNGYEKEISEIISKGINIDVSRIVSNGELTYKILNQSGDMSGISKYFMDNDTHHHAIGRSIIYGLTEDPNGVIGVFDSNVENIESPLEFMSVFLKGNNNLNIEQERHVVNSLSDLYPDDDIDLIYRKFLSDVVKERPKPVSKTEIKAPSGAEQAGNVNMFQKVDPSGGPMPAIRKKTESSVSMEL